MKTLPNVKYVLPGLLMTGLFGCSTLNKNAKSGFEDEVIYYDTMLVSHIKMGPAFDLVNMIPLNEPDSINKYIEIKTRPGMFDYNDTIALKRHVDMDEILCMRNLTKQHLPISRSR